MTDTRRQAAEEWASHEVGSPLVQEHGISNWKPTDEWLLAVKAHISGDELGEQREREEVARELRRLAALWGESQPGASLRQAAERFERGEWKEEKP